jgi:adenine-specific DNA-methyltransferase
MDVPPSRIQYLMSFRDGSIRLTTSLTKEEKQANGIFFTPKEARDEVFAILDSHSVTPRSILEPSFGSGEFIEDLYSKYPAATITGVELNTTLFESVHRPHLHNADFLTYSGKHDLIVGNPPYFVIPKSEDTSKCQIGRPNIFVQFLYKAIDENLADNGYLAFVLPTSLFNCGYYEPMRRYLFQHTTIISVKNLSGSYIDTAQNTFALVLQKGKRNNDFFVTVSDHIYLTPFYREISTLCKGSRSLAELGYSVKTGDVVWNQEKDKLADSGTLLIYSSNFSKGTLELGNLKAPKKQYITGFKRDALSGKTILINRGYGNTTYKLIPVIADYPSYYAENHVNVIKPTTARPLVTIEKVYASLCDLRTAEFIRHFVGNGALSKTEIETCLPIWTS